MQRAGQAFGDDELERAARKSGLVVMARHARETARKRSTEVDGRRSRISVTTYVVVQLQVGRERCFLRLSRRHDRYESAKADGCLGGFFLWMKLLHADI